MVVKALREKTGGDDCANQIKSALQQIEVMLKIHPDVIEKEFKLVLKRII